LVEKATTNGNGHTNGHANGSASNGLLLDGAAEEKLDAEHRKIIDGWEVGKDPKVDSSGHFDFGGSWGVGMMMVGFPLLMYYMWIGATFYDGKFPVPEEGQGFVDFVKSLGRIVYEHAFPSLNAWKIYWTFFVFEGACYCLMPGVWTYGKPLALVGGKQL
jgi:delta24(24(1))-sterol reductase